MKHTPLMAGALLFALASPALCQEAKAVATFKRAFKKAKTRKPVSLRVEALTKLGDADTPAVAKMLVAATQGVVEEVAEIDAERLELADKLKQMVDRSVSGPRQTIKRGMMNTWRAARQRFGLLRSEVDETRDLQMQLCDRIQAMRELPTLRWLLQNVTGKKKYSIHIKLAAARASGRGGVDVLDDLQKALGRSKRTAELVALLDGVGLLGADARSISEMVIKLLSHKDEEVRERASLALSRVAVPQAIEPMINLLARSEGQMKNRVAGHLEILTRKGFGTNTSTWRNWFRNEGAEFLTGKHELGGGSLSAKKKFDQKNYYFGIPQDGKSIIYIIDRSGSMKREVNLRRLRKKANPGGTVAKSADADKSGSGKRTTRMEACKEELIRAIGRLSPTTKFNVIWFNHEAQIHKPAMEAAKPDAVKSAQGWVRKLGPNSSTNIHDALQLAFSVAGKGARQKKVYKGKAVKPAFDTIFLLTDGSPTKPPGDKPDSTEKIIQAVRTWNPLKRVTIHCIGIGNGVNRGFMETLARENNGEFKHIID